MHKGWIWPVNGGVMSFSPNESDFQNLYDLVHNGTFSSQEGWNKVGGFKANGRQWDWSYPCAPTAQGYLYYYFALAKKSLVYFDITGFITHYCGELSRENSEPYKTRIQSLIPV